MLTRELQHLVKQAITHTRDSGCTFGTALLTQSGAIVFGETLTTAVDNHATARPADPISAIAYIHGPTANVVPPNGHDREAIYQICPTITVVVRDATGLIPRSAAELFPFPWNPRDLEQPQQISMWKGYEELVSSRRKQQTIRIDDPFHVGTAEIVFDNENGSTSRYPATVTEVRIITRGELTELDAQRDGFASLAELQAALEFHYPGLDNDGEVDIVTFALD